MPGRRQEKIAAGTRLSSLGGWALLSMLLTVSAGAAPGLPVAGYDDQLCVTAQRIIVGQPDIAVRVQRGVGNGFYTIQMSIDDDAGELVVAMDPGGVADGEPMDYVACKMVNRDRVNNVLGLALSGPEKSCRDVNEHTLQVALALLNEEELARYLDLGRPLRLGPDTIVPTGGEWLPARVDDYMDSNNEGITISSPSVRVPWDAETRGFFQGTHHCKLITLAATQRWMRELAFVADASFLPPADTSCSSHAPLPSAAGSCVFYFGPMNALYCQDYSGPGWTAATGRAECAKRHASQQAQQAAGNRYAGKGGLYSREGCATRPDAPEITGTCVFNCGQPDEALWQIAGERNAMIDRACDLYLPVGGP